MKIPLFIGLLAFGSTMVPSAFAGVADVKVTEVAPDQELPLVHDPSELAPVGESGLLNPGSAVATKASASVPESAAAGFMALLGYILILRRRTD